MSNGSVELYDNVYADFASSAETAVRRETYGEDLGQSSWLTASEWLGFADQLGVGAGSEILEGDPRPWTATGDMPAALSFLNTTKYPTSFSFLLMTLGPTIALIPLLDRARGVVADWVGTFGRVPFFFYVLHIPLIHGLALLVSWSRQGSVSPWLFANHPMGNPPAPEGYTWSLGLLYLVWAVAIVILYPACRWFADLKATRKEAWLSYL
jgi:hypothetical protein